MLNPPVIKCGYCGCIFTPEHTASKYCSDECKSNAKEEQNRNNFHKWYHLNKHSLSEYKRYGLGTGTLGPHRHEDVGREYKAIKGEFRRLKI